MNFSVPVNEDQTRIKVVKKADLAARHESRRALLEEETAAALAAETGTSLEAIKSATAAALAGHVHASNSPASAISATVVPAPKTIEPKVQLMEVEPGIYDVYFTCSCGEQYVIRCESLAKAAAK